MKHRKVSAVALDPAEAAGGAITPPDWNDSHIIEPKDRIDAMIRALNLAEQGVIGRGLMTQPYAFYKIGSSVANVSNTDSNLVNHTFRAQGPVCRLSGIIVGTNNTGAAIIMYSGFNISSVTHDWHYATDYVVSTYTNTQYPVTIVQNLRKGSNYQANAVAKQSGTTAGFSVTAYLLVESFLGA